MIVGEVAFGVALALIVGGISVGLVAEQRVQALEDISGVIAASLMPVVADQDQRALEAQLGSITSLGQTFEIENIRIQDGTGIVLAEVGTAEEVTPGVDGTIWDTIAGARTIAHPVVVDGIEVALVTVTFAPVGLGPAMTTPLLAAAIVVVAVGLISAPWSAWLVLHEIIEPVTALRNSAVGIARGKHSPRLASRRSDEIGELALTLDWMSDELDAQEGALMASFRSLESAYATELLMKREVEELMRLKSDFVAVASHELRSPLAVARLYAEMLESGVYGDLGPESRQAVDSMVSAMTRLTSITSDLMDAALLERGLMPLNAAQVDLTTLVSRAAADATLLASARGVVVNMHADAGEPCTVFGDEMRIRQVLDNLLSNAVKYSYESRSVEVSIESRPDLVLVRIEDTGRGIPEEGRSQVFDLFGRMDYRDDREVAGLGLGLTISSRIAEAHGGRIYIESSVPEKGSIFVLELPAESDATTDGLPDHVSME